MTFIITSAPIEYKINNHDIYDSFDLVSRGIKTAPLKENPSGYIQSFKFPFDIKVIKIIYCANQGQTLETAKILKQNFNNIKTINPTPLLDNINFSMRDLISKKQFETLSYEEFIRLARNQFALKLFRNELPEKMKDLTTKINLLEKIARDKNNSLMIGHSFFVKIFEIINKNPDCLKNEQTFINSFNPDKKPYNPLEGFKIDCK